MTAHTPSGQLASIQPPKDDAVFAALIAAAQRRLAELETCEITPRDNVFFVSVEVERGVDGVAYTFDWRTKRDPAPSVEPDEACEQFNPQDHQPEREAEEQPAPITESLMRQAQVGWVVRTKGGHVGTVVMEAETCFLAEFYKYDERTYYRTNGGKYFGTADYDIVSLSPPVPEVVADVAEVLL